MHIEIIKGNLFESNSDVIILTVDGARKGMEGTIARAFGRLLILQRWNNAAQ